MQPIHDRLSLQASDKLCLFRDEQRDSKSAKQLKFASPIRLGSNLRAATSPFNACDQRLQLDTRYHILHHKHTYSGQLSPTAYASRLAFVSVPCLAKSVVHVLHARRRHLGSMSLNVVTYAFSVLSGKPPALHTSDNTSALHSSSVHCLAPLTRPKI